MSGLLRVGCLLVCTFAARGQDWAADIQRACTSTKLGMRLAAAKKIASGGDDAIHAIQAWEKEHGRNSLALTLVEAIASAPGKSDATIALLLAWTRDHDFYWRAQALGGLATASNTKRTQHRAIFIAALADPAHTFRIQAAKGLIGLDTATDRQRVIAAVSDPDPRARTAIAIQLLDAGEKSAIPALLEALHGCDREFLGDPWGRRDANLAKLALERFLGAQSSFDPDKTAEQNKDAILALVERLKKLGIAAPESRASGLAVPKPSDLPRTGFEIRSCKHGDLFVRIGADGQLWFGLLGERRERLSEEAVQTLSNVRKAITGDANQVFGVLICDFLRWKSAAPDQHWKCAPGAVPASLVELLKTLAERLETTKLQDLAEQIRVRLRQLLPG